MYIEESTQKLNLVSLTVLSTLSQDFPKGPPILSLDFPKNAPKCSQIQLLSVRWICSEVFSSALPRTSHSLCF